MSSKSSIFLTNDGEHWYIETSEEDNEAYRVYIEIDSKNIKYFEKNDDYILIGIRGNSHLAKTLKLCRNMEEKVKG